eukprot:3066027-Rhodomonas_salina.1
MPYSLQRECGFSHLISACRPLRWYRARRKGGCVHLMTQSTLFAVGSHVGPVPLWQVRVVWLEEVAGTHLRAKPDAEIAGRCVDQSCGRAGCDAG